MRAHVVVHAKARFFAGRGTLSFAADDIRPVGVGELLARLEQLRSVLAAEGLFAADRKRPLPFLMPLAGRNLVVSLGLARCLGGAAAVGHRLRLSTH